MKMNNTSSSSDVYLTQPLTQREIEILSLFAAGRSNRATADQLSLALSTVKWYGRQIYAKLGESMMLESSGISILPLRVSPQFTLVFQISIDTI